MAQAKREWGVAMNGFMQAIVDRCRGLAVTVAGLAPPRRCESLAELAARSGGTVQVRQAARLQEYGAVPAAAADMAAFLSGHRRVTCGEEIVATVPGGRVVHEGAIVSPDGQTVARDVSIVVGRVPDHDHPLCHLPRMPRSRRLRGRVLNAATAGGRSYYHWLVEELPRLVEGVDHDPRYVIAHRGRTRQVLDLLGCAAELIEAETHVHSRCDELVVGHLHGPCGYPAPLGVERIRDVADRFALPRSHAEKIYVSRAGAAHRRVVREGELWDSLESRGFVRLDLERMSWAEQIAAFANARVVVAPHGAGLSNVVFCPPGAIVIELFNRRYVHACYWMLCDVRGLDYRPVVERGEGDVCNDLAALTADIDVAPGDVLAALHS